MVNYTPTSERENVLFKTPFDLALDPNHRWIKLAKIAPWHKLARVYEQSFSSTRDSPSVDLRIIIGTLFLKHIENLSDERVIQYIQDCFYAQAFLGLSSVQTTPVFDPSLLVTVRKRLGEHGAKQLNRIFVDTVSENLGFAVNSSADEDNETDGGGAMQPKNTIDENSAQTPAKTEYKAALDTKQQVGDQDAGTQVTTSEGFKRQN